MPKTYALWAQNKRKEHKKGLLKQVQQTFLSPRPGGIRVTEQGKLR